MQVSRKHIILSLVVFLAALPGFSDAGKTGRFLASIGVEEQMSVYPQLLSLYIQYNPNLGLALNMGVDREVLAKKINGIVTETNYFAEAVERFGKVYDEKRAAFYLQWVATDLGRKITEMEKLSSAPDAAYLIMAYGAVIGQSPPSKKRIELVTRLARRTGGGREASELIYQIESGVVAGLREKLQDEVHIRPAVQSPNQALLDDAVLTSSLYTYQNATDEELAEYVAILEHKDMVWCLDQLGVVFRDLVYTVSREVGLISAPFFKDSSRRFVVAFDGLDYTISRIELEGFTVAFPKSPNLQQESIPSDDGVVPMSIYYTSYDDLATSFYASTSTYPQAVVDRKSPYDFLDDVVVGMIGQDKVLVEKRTISMGTIPGYEIRLSVYNGMMLMRSMVFLEDDVLTQITFFAPAYIHFHPKSDEFFQAFDLN
jgi:hypothetical protein